MNIYQYALKLEKESESYYNELISKTSDVGLQTILKMLADEEVKHFRIIEKMMENDACPKCAESDILKNSKNIFMKIKGKKFTFDFHSTQADFYRKAVEFEKKSYKNYLEMSEQVEDEAKKKLLLKLADEEKKHMFLIENLVDFVSRPETWIENAEFNHLDEY